MARPDSGLMRARALRIGIPAVLLFVLPALAMRSAFGGYFLLDDFGMLSIARLIGNPLSAFAENHIPGGLYYRPLGIQLWWLSERVFGAHAALHYLCNAILQGAVVVATWRWLLSVTGSTGVAFAAAVVFAVHPVAIGTSLWLSDRFDLLAMLFGVLGLHAGSRFAAAGHARDALASLACLALALLSKEIALVSCAAVGVLWLLAEPQVAPRRRVIALIALGALVAAWFALRWSVIADAGASHMFGARPLSELLANGLGQGLVAGIDYLSFLPLLAGWKTLFATTGLVLLLSALLLAARCAWNRHRVRLLACGAVLVVAPLLLQFPLLAFQNLELKAGGNALLVALNARHFYVVLVGVLVIVAATVAPWIGSRDRRAWLVTVGVLLLVVAWGSASQRMARIHRDETRQQQAIVEAANAALASSALPSTGCRIFLLETGNWPFAWVSDEAIKATTDDLDRVAACLIQTEHTPWYHIVDRQRFAGEDLAPLVLSRGAARAPLGAAEILVLNLSAAIDAKMLRGAVFLRWRDGRFDEVTADVLAGRYTPGFHCNRRPAVCPP